MKIKRHHFYTTLITLSLMTLAITLLFVNDWLAKRIDPEVKVRSIQVATLPPPPPPPPPMQQVQQTVQTMSLSMEGNGAAMDISLIKIKLPQMQLAAPPMMTTQDLNLSDALAIDWQAFGLDDLDGVPTVVTNVSTAYPRSLSIKGINRVKLKLDIFIDELGKPRLIAVKGQQYKELIPAVTRLIKRSRFTPPTKNGVNVVARFIWPVEFKKS